MSEMTEQYDLERLLSLRDRAKAIDTLYRQIASMKYNFHKKDLINITDSTPYNAYGYYKCYVVVGHDKPEFITKLTSSITSVLNNHLEGYGPLIQFHKKQSVRNAYSIDNDYQGDYERDRKTIEQYKQELEWMNEYDEQLNDIAERKQLLLDDISLNSDCDSERGLLENELEALERFENDFTKDGLEGFLIKHRKKQSTLQKRRDTIARKKKQSAVLTESTNTLEPIDSTSTLDKHAVEPFQYKQETQTGIVELDLSWNNDASYITTPINAFSNKNANYKTQLINITNYLNKCDTSLVDYTKDGINNHSLTPFSDRFCDNIVVSYPLSPESITQYPALTTYIEKQRRKKGNRFEMCNRDKPALQGLGAFLEEHKAKLKRLLSTIDIDAVDIKPTKAIYDHGRLTQLLKVGLADAPLNKVIRVVCDQSVIQLLNDNDLFIHDIDITQDFAGTFNKHELIQYLVEQDGRFQVAGSKLGLPYTIRDDDHKVGSSCIEIMGQDELTEQKIRYKVYNKFIQSLESKGVRTSIGNHVMDWIHNPSPMLGNSIEQSFDYGLLRLEITYYMDERSIMESSTLFEHMDWLTNLIPPTLIYHQSIPRQWQLYGECIRSNMCVIDLDHKQALVSYAINRLTTKINGFLVNASSSNNLSNIVKQFTFNVPIYVVLFRRIGDQLAFQYHTYTKRLIPNKKLDTLPTYLTTGEATFARADKVVRDRSGVVLATKPEPQQMGLIDLPHVSLSYAPKDAVSKKTSNVPIVFDTIEYHSLTFPDTSRSRRNKNHVAEDAQQRLIQLNKQQLASIRESNKIDQEKVEEIRALNAQLIQQKQETVEQLALINAYNANITRITALMKRPYGNVKALVSLDNGTKLYVYGIRYTNTRYGETVIIASNTEPNNDSLTCYWGNTVIKSVVDKWKDTWGFIEPNILLRATNHPLMIVETRGWHYTKSHNKCVDVSITPIDSNELVESINTEPLQQQLATIECDYKAAFNEAPVLETERRLISKVSIDSVVKEGDVIRISACYPYRTTYIVECCINDAPIQCLKSNKWLDELLEEHETKFKVMVGVKKYYSKAKKSYYSFLVGDDA